MHKSIWGKLFLTALTWSIQACGDISFQGNANDVPTAGQVKIGFEPGDSFMVSQWLYIFHSQYPKASVTPIFAEKEELVSMLLKDSLQGIFMHDTFSKSEQNWLSEKKNATVNEISIGFTAPVFITSKSSSLKNISFRDTQNWAHYSINKLIVRSRLCSEEQYIHRYIKSIFKDSIAYLQHPYVKLRRESLPSDKKIVEYIAEHPNVIGVISLNTVADKRDSLSVALQRMVRILPVENKKGQYHLPFQSQLRAKQYPIIQPIKSYETQGYSGLVKGFVIYVNSQSGQALLQKSGLIPANYQGRKIQIDLN